MRFLLLGHQSSPLDCSKSVCAIFAGWNHPLTPQQTRTTAIILITCFLHSVTYLPGKLHSNLPNLFCDMLILSGVYYLPLYFQVLGSSASNAAIWWDPGELLCSLPPDMFLRMVPFSVVLALTSAVAGLTVSRTGAYRGIICAAWGIMILGWSLMTTLNDHSIT